jgi:hypothetical protein
MSGVAVCDSAQEPGAVPAGVVGGVVAERSYPHRRDRGGAQVATSPPRPLLVHGIVHPIGNQ